MTSPSKTWDRVEKDVEQLGTDVRRHLSDVNTETAAERDAIEKSVRALLSAVEDGVTAAGKALRDPKLCQDVTNLATSVRDALRTTFESAGVQVKDRLGVRPGGKAEAKGASSVPAPATKRPRTTTATKTTRAASTPRTPRKRAAG